MARSPLLQARIPEPVHDALRREAVRTGQSLTSCVRELLMAELSRRGQWPPPLAPEEARRAG